MLTPELLCETDPKQESIGGRLLDWLEVFASVCVGNLSRLNLQNDIDQLYVTTCLNVGDPQADAPNDLPGDQDAAL